MGARRERGLDNRRHVGEKCQAIRLVQAVAHGLADDLVAPGLQGREQQGHAPGVKSHVGLGILGGQQFAPGHSIHRE